MKLCIARAFERRRCTKILKNIIVTQQLISFVIFSVFSFLFSCAEKTPRGSIPFAPVDFEIILNGLDHVLRNPLSFKVFTEQDRRFPEERFGFSGVVIVSSATANELYAYDLCCPHENKREIKIAPRDDDSHLKAAAACSRRFMVAVPDAGSCYRGVAKLSCLSPSCSNRARFV